MKLRKKKILKGKYLDRKAKRQFGKATEATPNSANEAKTARYGKVQQRK